MEQHGTEDVTTDWFYEDQVVNFLVSHLRDQGWIIGRVPSATLKEQGVDVTATRGEETLLVEAKGYPSRFYRDESRRHEQKRTDPNNQAQQWYSHALLKAVRLKSKHPSAQVAMAFPDFRRYRQLFVETAPGLEKLGIIVFIVRADGIVETADKFKSDHPSPVATPAKTYDSKSPASSVKGKYADLSSFFRDSNEAELVVTFSELDRVTGGLPKSARSYRVWWANHAANSQAVWMRHGYSVLEVSFSSQHVVFTRT